MVPARPLLHSHLLINRIRIHIYKFNFLGRLWPAAILVCDCLAVVWVITIHVAIAQVAMLAMTMMLYTIYGVALVVVVYAILIVVDFDDWCKPLRNTLRVLIGVLLEDTESFIEGYYFSISLRMVPISSTSVINIRLIAILIFDWFVLLL